MVVDVADALEHHEPGQLRQVDVEHDEIGALASHALHGGLAVVCAHDVVSLAS